MHTISIDGPSDIIKKGELNIKLGNSHVFMKIHRPDCGYCVELAPKWEQVKSLVSKMNIGSGKQIIIADVNGSEIDNLNCNMSVNGFPTLRYFRNGKHIEDFQEERTVENMVNWIKRNAISMSKKKKKNKSNKKKKTNKKKKKTNKRRTNKRK